MNTANVLQFGVASGLGLFPMTFDWAQIAYIGSPLLTPWWAAANVVGGLVIVMWIIAPIMCRHSLRYGFPGLTRSRLQKRPLLCISPYPFVCRI